MSDVSPITNKQSPKTPGGIRKSLLTPCRRVGLSRKWRKSGCSPFISPLSSQNATPEGTAVPAEKKRKTSDELEKSEINSEADKEQFDTIHTSSLNSPMSCNMTNKNNDITSTPCRNTHMARKKSKTLSLSLKNSQETDSNVTAANQLQNNKTVKVEESQINVSKEYNTVSTSEGNRQIVKEVKPVKQTSEENLSKPVRTQSKSKKLSLKKSLSKNETTATKPKEPEVKGIEKREPKENSPNNLTKECIVVIQNKILKSYPELITGNETEKYLQESDSEPDIPLSEIKKESIENVTLNTLDDGDFISESVKKPIRNLSLKRNKANVNLMESGSSSQSSQEDTGIKTIIIKKTYDKVTKPLKAKSTGSITQKDIDELKARIEMKKKLLLAKAMSIDTEELRGLIKKWQKGCQDALMELLDLMKKKLPDRQNMDYSEILAALKIPADLIGYDSENDCFVTPDDTNMLLSAFRL